MLNQMPRAFHFIVTGGRSLKCVEKELILSTLWSTDGNKTQAAKILGVSVRTIRNKLKQYKEESAGTLNHGHGGPSYGARTLRSEDNDGRTEVQKMRVSVQGEQKE